MQEKILILDFGSQYTQLIARRVRELNVYCEIHPFNRIPALDASVRGVILSGSPYSVRDKEAPRVDLSAIKGKLPLLGVCYGAQYLSHCYGGEVAPSATREYGRAMLSKTEGDNPLIRDLSERTQVWMSHGDTIVRIPESYRIIASTEDVPVAAFQIDGEQTWGIQFHPEVYHSTEGKQLLKHFVVDICGCRQDWTPASFVESTVAELREKIGPDKVLLGLSGGVDSSVAAMLLHRAVGRQLICIFVDMGLLRKDEFENVLKSYESMGLNVIGVRAGEKFLSDLKGVTDPERKRKIIGRDFIEVFDAEAQKLTDVRWLAQGTIYPDVIESTSVNGPSATIKSHHNVGGLPEKMNLKIVEPLRLLFKDEVRRVGRQLEIPSDILNRHPFPGPGLGIRILGEVTAEKMHRLGIRTGADLRLWNEAALVQQFGKAGHSYYGYARGIDEREVTPNRVRKSLGAETTFAEDTDDRERLRLELSAVREEVWNRVMRHEFRGKTVVLKLKFDNFRQITRSKTLFTPVDSAETLRRVSEELLAAADFHGRKIRLIGLTVGNSPEACPECVQLRFDFGNPEP